MESYGLDYIDYNLSTDFNTYIYIFKFNDGGRLASAIKSTSLILVLDYLKEGLKLLHIKLDVKSMLFKGNFIIFEQDGIKVDIIIKHNNCLIYPERLCLTYMNKDNPYFFSNDDEGIHKLKVKYLREYNGPLKLNGISKELPQFIKEISKGDIIRIDAENNIIAFKYYIPSLSEKVFCKLIAYDRIDDIYSNINEAYISLKYINNKLIQLPYFAKLMGFSFNEKSFHHIFTKKNLNSFGVLSLIYENIEGITLKEYINTCNINQFGCVLTQILFAYFEANKQIGFTHYDLHLENILIKTLDSDIVIDWDGMVIKTKTIIKFIDYEFSYCHNSGEKDSLVLNYANIHGKNYWIYDIFKLLICLYRSTHPEIIESDLKKTERMNIDYIYKELSTKLSSKRIQHMILSIKDKFIQKRNSINQDKLLLFNNLVSRLLSFFCGRDLDLDTYIEYENINPTFSILHFPGVVPIEDFIRFSNNTMKI